jgi:PAS domain S-box-containing protein
LLFRGELVDGEVRFVFGEEERFYHNIIAPIRHGDQIRGILGINFDITERKRAEGALRESEERFRSFMDNSPTTAWMKDEQGRYVYLSKTFEDQQGICPKQWEGKTDFELWPLENAKEFRKTDLAVLASGQPSQSIEVTTNPARGTRWWWKFKFPIRDASGKRYVGGVGLDITERKQMEEELQKAHNELEDRVKERTAELRMSNDQLHREIAEHKRTQEALLQSEVQLRFLSSRLLDAQEDERKRIARELHDSIGQSLAAVKFNVENVLEEIGKEVNARIAYSLEQLIPLVQNSMEEVRRIYTGLRPSMLDDLGIIATIGWFCREFQKTYQSICIEQQIGIEEEEIPEPLKIVIFRIIQETFNNIARHSRAELVSLCLERKDGRIDLIIEDNGAGFDVDSAMLKCGHKESLGIAGMKERTELVSGAFFIESVIGEGTTIRASWATQRPSG